MSKIGHLQHADKGLRILGVLLYSKGIYKATLELIIDILPALVISAGQIIISFLLMFDEHPPD